MKDHNSIVPGSPPIIDGNRNGDSDSDRNGATQSPPDDEHNTGRESTLPVLEETNLRIRNRISFRQAVRKSTSDGSNSFGQSERETSEVPVNKEEHIDEASPQEDDPRPSTTTEASPQDNEPRPSTTANEENEIGAVWVAGRLDSQQSVGRARFEVADEVFVDEEPAETGNTSETLLQADVVDEQILASAEPLQFSKRMRLILLGVMAIVALVVGSGVLFGVRNANSKNNSIAGESAVLCTGIAGKPFETANELTTAVDLYLLESPALTQQYGSCMGDWDVSMVASFRNLFDPQRIGITTFNEDISRWSTSSVLNMEGMFMSNNEFNQDLSNWDVSRVTTMLSMFQECLAFDGNISSWNVESVTRMTSMFNGARSFNKPIGRWNTSAVTDMTGMFAEASSFNQDISGWNTSAVTDMTGMFSEASSFNQDISGWNMSSVISTFYMFEYARKFNQPIGGWDMSAMTDVRFMFRGAELFNQDISGWDMSSVTATRAMLEETASFNQDISGWDVSNVEDAWAMFYLATRFNSSIAGWDVRKMKDVRWMFWGAESFNQDLCEWLPKLPDGALVESMFRGSACPSGVDPVLPGGPMCHECGTQRHRHRPVCTTISGKPFDTTEELYQAVDLFLLGNSSLTMEYGSCMGDWDVSRIANFDQVFDRNRNRDGAPLPCINGFSDGCLSFYFDADLSRWNTSAATSMDYMFHHAGRFNSPLENWDVSGVTSMVGMFSFTDFNQPLTKWDVDQVTSMNGMFAYATKFNQDLSNWNVSSIKAAQSMFWEAVSFNQTLCEWLGHFSSNVDVVAMFETARSCPGFREKAPDSPVLGVGNGPMCHFC